MSHLQKHRENRPAPLLITKHNLPKGWIRTRAPRSRPHPAQSEAKATKSCGRLKWQSPVPETSLSLERSNAVMHRGHEEVCRSPPDSSPSNGRREDSLTIQATHDIHRDLLERRVSSDSVSLKKSTSSASSSGTAPSLVEKVRAALRLPLDREKPVYYGPKDNRGWLQRYAQRHNAKKREVEAYKETSYQVLIGGRRFTAWTSGEHGWIAVPTLAHPTWKEKLPFAKKMPDIYSFDRFDTADARHQRVDGLLDDRECQTYEWSQTDMPSVAASMRKKGVKRPAQKLGSGK